MKLILTCVLSIVLVELLSRLPLPRTVREVGAVSRKAFHVVSAKSISDHWKEKALLAYAAKLFASTLKLAGILGAAALCVVLSLVAADAFGYDLSGFLLSWPGILVSCAAAAVYFQARKALV